jgi:hypothetical protein
MAILIDCLFGRVNVVTELSFARIKGKPDTVHIGKRDGFATPRAWSSQPGKGPALRKPRPFQS